MSVDATIHAIGTSVVTNLAEVNRVRQREALQEQPATQPSTESGPVVNELSRVGRRVLSPVGAVREADDLYRPDLVAQMRQELAFGTLGGELDVERAIDSLVWDL